MIEKNNKKKTENVAKTAKKISSLKNFKRLNS